MPARRQAIAEAVAERLFAAETAIDIAAARIGELNGALPLARLDACFAAAIGQDALSTCASAMMLVAETRQKIVLAHDQLKQASDDVGITVSYGDLLKLPAKGQREQGLRRVA